MGWTVCTPDGKCLTCVELVRSNEEAIIYSDDVERCMSIANVVETNKTAIHILLAESRQVPADNIVCDKKIKRNDFNFMCVKEVAEAINSLAPSSNLIKITNTHFDNLEKSLSIRYYSDTKLIMWGDHSDIGDGTAIWASGFPNDKIYINYRSGRENENDPIDENKESSYLERGGKSIMLQNDIKLINYGCNGNLGIHRRRFEVAFRTRGENGNFVNNYLGKYNNRSRDRVITLDMINDLLTIGKSYAKKLKIESEQLGNFKSVFRNTLGKMRSRKEEWTERGRRSEGMYIDGTELSNKATEIEKRVDAL
ncbi:MAG: hypothetical protein LBU83_13965 [Bacteroidales bacterium]|jgi:hypothetical protein|nr:hypothetical protein [Bacteroidales bacterium]